MGYVILAINPGSTSTKIAVFASNQLVFEKKVQHDPEVIQDYDKAVDQLNYRLEVILQHLDEEQFDLGTVDAFVGRGGLLAPMQSGTYRVNDIMLDDLKTSRYGNHASNLGAIIADRFGAKYNKPAYTVNPVVVDEMIDEARYTGLPEFKRVSRFHALNQKAVAKQAAADMGIDYKDGNFIVAHMGGGISVGAHRKGKVIDVNNALEEGPWSPERAGGLPSQSLVELCFSGKHTKKEMDKLLVGRGGFYAYTGTTDMVAITEGAKNDPEWKKLLDAFAYRVAKEIGSLAPTLHGEVDRVVITGGLAHDANIVSAIAERVKFLAPVYVVPGEDELQALQDGVVHVLDGEEAVKKYMGT